MIIISSCDEIDGRIRVINQTKRTVICYHKIGENDKTRLLNCNDFKIHKKMKVFTNKYDTAGAPIMGNLDYLLEKDPIIIYFYDSARFEDYCRGKIPIDSTYKKYYFTKDELIKNNWTIVIRE